MCLESQGAQQMTRKGRFMCLEHDTYVQLGWCPHGTLHLRVANTTLHLTREQVVALHRALNRWVHTEPSGPKPEASRHNRYGQSRN